MCVAYEKHTFLQLHSLLFDYTGELPTLCKLTRKSQEVDPLWKLLLTYFLTIKKGTALNAEDSLGIWATEPCGYYFKEKALSLPSPIWHMGWNCFPLHLFSFCTFQTDFWIKEEIPQMGFAVTWCESIWNVLFSSLQDGSMKLSGLFLTILIVIIHTLPDSQQLCMVALPYYLSVLESAEKNASRKWTFLECWTSFKGAVLSLPFECGTN